MLAMSNMGSFSHDRWQCATVPFSTLALHFTAALDHFPRMVDVQRYGLRAYGKFAQCPSNKGLFLKDPEEQLASLRVIATIAKLHEKEATVQRYGLYLARGLGFESVQAIRKNVSNQDKMMRKEMEKRAEEEEQRREKAKRRAKMKQMSSKLANKTSWLAKANAGESRGSRMGLGMGRERGRAPSRLSAPPPPPPFQAPICFSPEPLHLAQQRRTLPRACCLRHRPGPGPSCEAEARVADALPSLLEAAGHRQPRASDGPAAAMAVGGTAGDVAATTAARVRVCTFRGCRERGSKSLPTPYIYKYTRRRTCTRALVESTKATRSCTRERTMHMTRRRSTSVRP